MPTGSAARRSALVVVTAGGALLATLVLAAAGGCRDAGGRPAANAASAASTASTALSGSPVRNVDPPPALDRSGAKGETVYRVLGMLDEYLGRQVMDEGDDVVERFYCNERAIADTFAPLLERMAQEQRIKTEIRRASLQDCLSVFHSPELRAAMVALYPSPAPGPPQQFAQLPDGRMTAIRQRFVHPDMFRGAAAAQKWAYLSGVYQRNGHGDSIVFANAAHKADLVAALLRELGVRDVERRTSEGGIPRANFVTFKPDTDQRAKLGPSLAQPLP